MPGLPRLPQKGRAPIPPEAEVSLVPTWVPSLGARGVSALALRLPAARNGGGCGL